MKLQYKQQQFQIDAVNAVVNCFEGQERKNRTFMLEQSAWLIAKRKELEAFKKNTQTKAAIYEELENEQKVCIGHRNASLNITETQLLENIQKVQAENFLHESSKLERVLSKGDNAACNLTIEMETGTGKTYTYIRTMHELYKCYGWSKFIIVVPSIAIREGTKNSFEVMADHFKNLYNQQMEAYIYNSAKPNDIESFASSNLISVLIINTQAFNATGKDARRIFMELDEFGSRRPIDIISQTNPILIVDEPQSVDGEKTLKMMQEFKPLFTIRYSATHKEGCYYNQVYRLDALDAYKQKLVKKIQVKGINIKGSTGTTGYIYLQDIIIGKGNPKALVEYEARGTNTPKRITRSLEEGAKLFELSDGMPQYRNYEITNINGLTRTIEVAGQLLEVGQAIGNVDEGLLRRIQIRETIYSHIERERQLYKRGVKVLSLFFIDSVEKYRQYDAENNEQNGEYARMFEEEYKLAVANALDLYEDEYNDYLRSFTDVSKIHNGYFSVDKKNRLVDPEKPKRGREDSDDVTAYDLIMKNKEQLLSFEEPTRFIFSHSTLKEGWDNPNVFQICALKHSDANVRRRQEVGRGMRLCVNKYGERLDSEKVGEMVHEINALTVVASESYEDYAKGLQSEIAAALKSRPQKADKDFFIGKLVVNADGEKKTITKDMAEELQFQLRFHGIIDKDKNLTELGRDIIKNETIDLSEEFAPYKESIQRLLNTLATGEIPTIENANDKVILSTNKNFAKPEFQALWNKINLKTVYEVHYDTEKLISDSIVLLNARLEITDRSYEVRTGELEADNKNQLENGTGFGHEKSRTKKINADLYAQSKYDFVGEIVSKTNLKRSTIVSILKGLHDEKLYLIKKNPEEFIAKASHFIKEAKAKLIIGNIVYHATNERYDAKDVFTNDRNTMINGNALRKHIYDYLLTDSKVEAEFAKELEGANEVDIYAKLPKTFKITTPIANYSPDWAIVLKKECVTHIYFIAETKGIDDDDMELKGIEALKIHCARKHFETICGTEVKFDYLKTYKKLLDIVKVK